MKNKLILFLKYKVMNELLICCMSFEFIKYLIYRKYYEDIFYLMYVIVIFFECLMSNGIM